MVNSYITCTCGLDSYAPPPPYFIPVDETTTDIICIKCKRDDSDTPNEIVLCDRCGIGEQKGM